MMSRDESTTNEDAFRAIYEACEEGIIAVDALGKIQMANSAAHTIFGYEKNELLGHTVEDLIPKNIKKHHEVDRKNYNHNPTPRRMGAGRDLLGAKKNGDHFPVEVSLNNAYLNGKRHVIAYIIDISARKKIEGELKKSEEELILYASQLEKRVKERTEELELANKALEIQIGETKKAEEEANIALEQERELNELKSRFVAMASHEFRTPLSTILSSAALIEKYQDQETQDKRQKHVTKIKSSINNLNGILDDFLSLSKLEEGKMEINNDAVDLKKVCTQVIEELSSIKKENQQIIFDTKGTHTLIFTDRKIIKNIVTNLISNAIKYSEKAITVEVDFRDPKTIKINIVDKGMGIAKEEQKHLFERFFRAKNVTNIQGTGLGLNIVKKYVDMLDGSISFESTLNKGTSFQVSLPKTGNL